MAPTAAGQPFRVAIIGGGLCGLALAIALETRSIPYTIYESRASFTEIGAGINLAPNSLEAFNLIDPSLRDVIFSLATRHPPGSEDVWLSVRLGAPTEHFEDAKLVVDIQAPPTGNTTISRNELLQALSGRIRSSNAKYNKRIVTLKQSSEAATMVFEDGSEENASVVIACDGAHSALRQLIVGRPDDPAAYAHYSQVGVYRAIVPMAKHEEAVGADIAHLSHVWTGPEGYIIQYPINGGKDMNIGVWLWKNGEWPHKAWVLKNQKAQMLDDLKSWGPKVQRMLHAMGGETQFWATFHHSVKPKSYSNGRAIFIGDASHAMGPHLGQGAAQSMEDAYVMSQVIQDLATRLAERERWESDCVDAAFMGYETIRRARFEKVLRTSSDSMSFWSDLWRPGLAEADLKQFGEDAHERMRWIWDARLKEQGEQACAVARETLSGRDQKIQREQAAL